MKKIFIVTAILIGILLALQIRSFKKVEILMQRSEPADVLRELRSFQVANQQLESHILEKEKNVEDLKSKIASIAIEEEINRYKLLAGEDPVAGEGVEIAFNKAIESFWITDITAHLVAAGADAVAVNNVRLTPQTAGFRNVGENILMRKYLLRPPFKISAIGPKDILNQSITQNGGIIDRIKNTHAQLNISVAPQDKIIIDKLDF